MAFQNPIGFVYFIQCQTTGLIKIGWTNNHPDMRLLQLRLMSPVRLVPLGAIRTHFRDVETDLHERFAEYRQHGEWFTPGEKLLEYIRRKGKRWPAPGYTGPTKEPSPERMRKAYERRLNENIQYALAMEKIRRRVKAREKQEKREKVQRERIAAWVAVASTG